MAATEAAVGIAVGIVALTAVGALAVGNAGGDDDARSVHPSGQKHATGQEQAEWAREHNGPPPWSHGHGHGKKDKDEKREKSEKPEKKDKDEERSS